MPPLPVHAFDPTVSRLPLPPNVPLSASSRIHFHRLGLCGAASTGKPGDGEYLTFDKVLARVGARRVHLLKLDIEGTEFDAVQQMGLTGSLAAVDQLQLEVHFAQVSGKASTVSSLLASSPRRTQSTHPQSCTPAASLPCRLSLRDGFPPRRSLRADPATHSDLTATHQPRGSSLWRATTL